MIRDQVPEAQCGKSYFDVEVKNPRTHIDKGKALYTDYEIAVKTNHPVIPLSCSCVRRRYSDFVWLRNSLGFSNPKMRSPPSLPGKQIIGRFKESFLIERQIGLQVFLRKLIDVEAYVMEPAFQLFLQTQLLANEMDNLLRRRTPGCIRSLIVRLNNKKGKKKEKRWSSEKVLSKEYPMFEARSRRSKSEPLTHSWSANHCPRTEPRQIGQEKERCSSESTPGNNLRLPTIPGSSEEDAFSMESELTTEEDNYWDEHPLSSSWHGQSHDAVDFILDEYEVIPLSAITQFNESDQDYAESLGYLDVSCSINALAGDLRPDRFDF